MALFRLFSHRRKRKKKPKKGQRRGYTPRGRGPALESRRARPARTGNKPRTRTPRKPKGFKGRMRYYVRLGKVRTLHVVKRIFLIGGIVTGLVVLWFYLSLPSIGSLNQTIRPPSIVMLANDGSVLSSYGNMYGDFIPYAQLPKTLEDAALATEDRHYYYHLGVDPLGIARALWVNYQQGAMVQGGSTITQQVAKNLFLTPERSLSRKVREMMLALRLEWRYSKEEILSIYFNRVYFGAGTYGVDAASKRYFNKSATALTLPESALLVGLLKAPSKFSPISNPDAAAGRAEQVLINMEDAGYLTLDTLETAKAALPALFNDTTRASNNALYFTDWVMEQMHTLIGSASEDLIVHTTLDPIAQKAAETSLRTLIEKEGAEKQATQGALFSLTPEGAVRAMAGGTSYAKSQYNRATQALRQPGSAFKLFVYLTALEGGLSPNSYVEDQPFRVGKWEPQNYNGEYQGRVSFSLAVAKSINSVAVQLSERFGRGNVIRMARRLGISSNLPKAPSIALGAAEVSLLELTTAYAHLASGGRIVFPYGIERIVTKENDEAIYTHSDSSRVQVLQSDIVGMMNAMLSEVIVSGTGRAAAIGRPAAGKTGTTSNYKDAWFIGYTPQLVTGVWVGNDDATSMQRVTGGSIPARIWKKYMQAALHDTEASPLSTSVEHTHTHKDEESDGFTLDSGFWDTLLNNDQVEYNYPTR